MLHPVDLAETNATVIHGDREGQTVYIESTQDGICLCNVGFDEYGNQKHTIIPRNHLVPHIAGQYISAISGIPRPRRTGSYDWSKISEFLSPAR